MKILHNKKFDISHLKVFGYTCYVHLQGAGKLDPHTRNCVIIHLLRNDIDVMTHNHNLYTFSGTFCLMKRIIFLSPCFRGSMVRTT
jgi:hypothetical protein